MSKATWSTYRMWRQVLSVIAVGGNSAESMPDIWSPTSITFRARSQPEAQKKADKFWRDAQLGSGSMICIPEGTTPQGVK
jgi:hypothetical protein